VLPRKEPSFIHNIIYSVLYNIILLVRIKLGGDDCDYTTTDARNLSKPSHKKSRTFINLHDAAVAINSS